MSSTNTLVLSITAAFLLARAYALPQSTIPSGNTTNNVTNTPLVSTFRPSEFFTRYNTSYCPANTLPIYAPPAFAYYPFPSHSIYDITGDYFNISWINPSFKLTTSGPDNTPGSYRNQTGDPFAAKETLTNYFADNVTGHGFYMQQVVELGPGTPATVMPGYVEVDSHPVIELFPACGGKGSQFGFYLTFCMAVDESKTPAGFNATSAGQSFGEAGAKGAAGALQHLWTTLDGSKGTAFNSTGSCDAIAQYQQQQKTSRLARSL